ncbi:LPXTG cell wall anchor domain-containing protein [Cellulosimicrobium cellulans]|uniref:prealbumin-like fold domain-containing protein n=1 Tax=Cellulosimicrobium cellulans TaxID=1710 RepID=UPI0019660FD0|nr:LPXTG cell wall anchor domain-containing protein [Cellulosimicrobium cellulans]MBN0039140.1 LPXTG cell wall anchor domain-containing protein [Cellulosimicrobium cellulans]
MTSTIVVAHGRRRPPTRADGWRLLAGLVATVLLGVVLVPVAPSPTASAATLEPSGLQTGMEIDGTSGSGNPPETFNWGDFITDVQPDGDFTFTPTGPYTTEQGFASSGIVQASFAWDNGSLAQSCNANPDQTGAPPSQSPSTNPWRPGPTNPNAKGDLCSSAYGLEFVVDGDGERHAILYGYWTRYVGAGEVSVFQHLVGPGPGRCDDVLLEFDYASSGTTAAVHRWTPTAGDGCANPLGPGTWTPDPGSVDFAWAVGVRSEGPPLTNQPQQTFGEFAIDLNTAGVLEPSECATYEIAEMLTRTGNSPNANIQDFADHAPDRMRIANCGSLTVTKATVPQSADTGTRFGFTVASDTGPVQPGPPPVPTVSGTLASGETVRYDDVLFGSGFSLTETDVPLPWDQQSVVCSAVPAEGGPPEQFVLDDPADRFPVRPLSTTDCVITNAAAVVTVTKQTVPDGSPQPFTFEATGQPPFSLADGESASFPVQAGVPFSVTEAPAAGWLPPEIECTAAGAETERSVTVTPVAGQNIECTFTNTQLGTVVVSKEAHGVDGRTFDFASDLPGNDEFSITVEQGDGTLYEHTIEDVPAGTYTIEELTDTQDPATRLADLACTYGGEDHSADPAGRTIDLTVLPGETVRCFFTNVTPGSIAVVKRTVPVEYEQEFDFLFTPPTGDPTPFSLSGSSTPPNVALRTFDGLAAGTYTITEPVDAIGWSIAPDPPTCNADFWTPTPDGRGVTIDLPDGGVIVCFFTNVAAPASLSLTKTVDGADPAFDWSVDVELVASDGTVEGRTATTTAPTVAWDELVPGATYTVREAGEAPPGWTRGEITCEGLTDADPAAPGLQVEATPGQEVSCAVVNTVATSSISVAKVATGIGGDLPWAFDVAIDPVPAGATSPQTVSGEGQAADVVTWSGLVPGTAYSITEPPVPGWDTVEVVCTGISDTDPQAPGVQFVAPVGADVSCTLTNTAVEGSGVLTKTSLGGDGTFEFVLTDLDGAVDPIVVPVTTEEGTATLDLPQIVPGVRYSFVESDLPGWSEGALSCLVTPADGGGPFPIQDLSEFSVGPGDAAECSVENARHATIVVAKAVDGADGTFGFTGNWQDAENFSITTEGGLGVATFDDVAPGSYTVEEIAQDGFENTDLACVDGDPGGEASGVSGGVGTIALDPGETVVCTFTNAPWGTLVVDKVTVPAGSSQEFELAWAPAGGEPTPFTLTDAAEPFTPGPLAPGSYTVTETPTPGWTLADLECVGSSGSTTVDGATATVDVLSGETVLCTFTNERPAALDVTKSVVEGPDEVEPGVLRIAYEVVVSSTATVARTYDLVDRLAFGGGIVVRDASVESLDGLPVADDWDGVDRTTVTSGATLAAGAAHRYRVTVVAQVPADVVPDALLCDPAGTEPGGFLNTVGVVGEDGATESEAAACAPAPEPPGPPQPPVPPDDGGGGAAPPAAGPTAPAVSDRPLPATGADTGWLLTAAALLLLGGGGLLVVRRVRRS